jgi:hypothetical protein
MSNLNKSTVGLGKVINRLQIDHNDLLVIMEKLDFLRMDNFIEGNWTTILDNPKVTYNAGDDVYEINLDNNNGVSIIVNEDGKKIRLSGGLNGRSFHFKFINTGSHIVYWDNVRARNAETPGLYVGTPSDPKVTTLVVCRVGNEYYITDINLNVH